MNIRVLPLILAMLLRMQGFDPSPVPKNGVLNDPTHNGVSSFLMIVW